MSDRSSGLTVALETVGHVAHAVWSVRWSRYLSWLGRLIAFPFKLAWMPIPYLAGVLAVALAPALHLFSYFVAWTHAVINFVTALQPLYIFFGTAAAVGVIAGVTLAISSSIIAFYLGMQDHPYEGPRRGKKHLLHSSFAQDESSSNEADWYLADLSPARRRPATGLLSQTILEEDDSEM